MPTELILLTDEIPSTEVFSAQSELLFPGGTLLNHVNSGVYQYVDADERPLLSMFTARPIQSMVHADTMVPGGVSAYAWWTDLTIPYGDPQYGRAIANNVATATGGRVVERI